MTKNESKLLSIQGIAKASAFCLLLSAFSVNAAMAAPAPAGTVDEVMAVQQGKKVTGVVVDGTGEPVIGANVVVKGTTNGTITDFDGNYTIEGVSANDVLVVSYIGYLSQEIPVGNQSAINVTLKEDTQTLDEVVVVGYGTMRKSDVTGSISTAKGEEMLKAQNFSALDNLRGKAAGVNIFSNSSQPGAYGSRVVIRGQATINASSDPLYVVDGVVMENFYLMNPNDIESMEVLKDASATAIYGSKASNGVIEITTKKNTTDRLTVNYSANFNIGQRPNYGMFNFMNSQERVRFSQEAFDAGVNYIETPYKDLNTYEGILRMLQEHDISDIEYRKLYNDMETRNTDWFKRLTRRSFSHTHNVSVSGGTNKFSYSASIGYNNSEGQEIGNDNERMTGRIALMLRPIEKLTINLTLNGSVSTTNGFFNEVNPMSYATNTNRIIDPDAYYMQRNGYNSKTGKIQTLSYNFINERDNSGSKARSNFMSASLDVNWRILDWVTYQFTGGYSNNNSTNESWATERTYYIANEYRGYDFNSVTPTSAEFKAAQLPFGGILYTNDNNQYSYNIQNKLQFSKAFNPDNRLNALLGMELRSSTAKGTANKVWGYVPDRGERIVAPTIPSEVITPNNPPTGWGILGDIYSRGWQRTDNTNNFLSFFATFAYSFKNRYVVNANVRNDASNVFGQDINHRIDPTYSFGLSWRASEEAFFQKHLKWITTLNFRGTFGIQGNALTRESPELILSQQGVQPGYNRYFSTIGQIPNPYLSWERTRNWNFGVDLELFRMFYMNLEYYTRRSNAVITVDLPFEYGIDDMKRNGGIIYNRGIEYTLSFTPIQKRDFSLNINLNASKNWNKGGETKIDRNTAMYLRGGSTQILKEGYPLSAFWSYSFAGLDGSNGKPMFNYVEVPDEEKSKSIDPTTYLVYSGETEPYFTGGLGFSFRYKSLSLNTSFSLLLGSKKRLPSPYSDFQGSGSMMPDPTKNVNRDLLNRWQKPGDEVYTNIPGLPTWPIEIGWTLPNTDSAESAIEMWEKSDAMVVSGSFLRCRNIGLSWQMKKEWCDKIHAKNLAINFNMDNIFVIASKRFNLSLIHI